MQSWLLSTIGRVISSQRHQKRLTLGQLGASVNIGIRELIQIEHGTKEIDLVLLNEICLNLDMTVAELLQNATHLDNERIILVTSSPETFQELETTHRDVVFFGHADLEGLLNWRVDVLCIAPEFEATLQHEIATLQGKGIPVISLSNENQDELVALIDVTLSKTHKGLVCSMRRNRDVLAARRKELTEQRAKIKARKLELQDKTEALLARHAVLSAASKQTAANGSAKHTTLAEYEHLRALHKRLEHLETTLTNRESALTERETMNDERARFLKRGGEPSPRSKQKE